MAQTKYKLPDDLKIQCLSYVRGYKRRVQLYHERRADVIDALPKILLEEARGTGLSDVTAIKAIKLQRIENLFDTKVMRAVEEAKFCIGVDLDDTQRQRLTTAIWDSCIEGKAFIFEYYNLNFSKSAFYDRRYKFLYDIANKMEFI